MWERIRPVRDAGGMLTQAEEGMKLFAAQNGAAAEIDKAAAEAYKADIEARTSDGSLVALVTPFVLCLRDFGHFASLFH